MYRASAKPLRRLPIVERLAIPTPCDARWDEMEGEGPVRQCGICKKGVYDLRGMPTVDADEFLARYVADHRVLSAPTKTRRDPRSSPILHSSVSRPMRSRAVWSSLPMT